MKWLVVLLACAGCKQHAEPDPPAPAARPVIPVSEVKRGQDACKAYVAKVCACAETVPAMKHDCELSRSYPEAMQVSLDVAATADSTRLDVLQANDSVRKIVKQCIEATAKLPAAGCP